LRSWLDTSLAGLHVTRVVDEIIAERGPPRAIRCDDGQELTSRHFLAWSLDRKIDLSHIQPGKPTQYAIANWRSDYDQRRPHSSLNYRTPSEFAAQANGGKWGQANR